MVKDVLVWLPFRRYVVEDVANEVDNSLFRSCRRGVYRVFRFVVNKILMLDVAVGDHWCDHTWVCPRAYSCIVTPDERPPLLSYTADLV